MLLDLLYQKLSREIDKEKSHIPAIWINPFENGISSVNYAGFLAERLSMIIQNGQQKTSDEMSRQKPVIYNIFVRLFTAFDHDQDGRLGNHPEDSTIGEHGIRETGTFLKTIALLPYLKKLGINTIHLLPITKIGLTGRKGDLGSPYAIKNPYEIDPLLADPVVDLTVEQQFAALVEAAHRLGMRVVQEFIFRTASIDSDWTLTNPQWFYWIKDQKSYRPPAFDAPELAEIKLVPKGRGAYLPPPKSYRDLFAIPPKSPGHNLKVASAFADWPPDDLQPPWTDVTYLRLYNYKFQAENNFNYIAYNTVRYYDPELARPENINHPVWETISEIIPHFQKAFGIDGAMIDMGHALPEALKMQIISKARAINSGFTFWDENFENKIKTKNEGYDAVIGGSWFNITKRGGFRSEIINVNKKLPLPFFGTAETHNSPRYGFNQKRKKFASWLLFNLLPQSMPFVHNGFELNESLPVNTGLNFTKAEIENLAKASLPLFYKNGLNWNPKINILPEMVKIGEIRQKHPWIFNCKAVSLIRTDNPRLCGLEMNNKEKRALAIFNTNFRKSEQAVMTNSYSGTWMNLITDRNWIFEKTLRLKPGEVLFVLAGLF